MMKKMITWAIITMAMVQGIHAQTANTVENKSQTKAVEEKDIVANPTEEQLVGIWQILDHNAEERKYGPYFKILDANGRFRSVSLINRQTFRCGVVTRGIWTVEDGALIETIDSDCKNIFAGKKNAMEMTLSDGGNTMHIIWVNIKTGIRTDEYWEKVQ